MTTGLIERRHPLLGAMLRIWRACPDAQLTLPGSLAPLTVQLLYRDGDWRVGEVGAAIDALYGRSLTNVALCDLAADREDLASAAEVAWNSGQPLLLESALATSTSVRRVARLYLPVRGAEERSVLCGMVACD